MNKSNIVIFSAGDQTTLLFRGRHRRISMSKWIYILDSVFRDLIHNIFNSQIVDLKLVAFRYSLIQRQFLKF